MSAIVEPISPNKAQLIIDQQETMKMVRSSDGIEQEEEENKCNSPMNEEKDKDDERLSKEQPGSVDDSAVREDKDAEVQEPRLYIICPDRPDLELSEPFISTPKACLFTLKEGSRYKLKFSFTVSNNVVSGLKYINTTWKSGVRVDKSEVMLGTFSPRKEPYVYELEEDVTPSGVFARGLYSARTQVIDEKGTCYVDIKYYFDIQKQWLQL
uniref:Rho guanine dissociation inhibitor n=1 Tax=Petunia integrifolia subsp. inflata TaxID=212142 RepID=Q06E26_PETIN|nr:Rho guanine dissociation inhibitor [Petunia integrifolia subsp. inflata]